MPPIRYLSMEVSITAIRAYRGHIVREWESVSVYFRYKDEKTWAPKRWRTDMGRGWCIFLFKTSDLQMLMLWHDFPAFFLHFFCKSYLLCVCWKIRNYSQAKYAYLEAFMSWSASGWARAPPPPPPFLKSMLKRKRKKDGEKNKWPANVTNKV